MRNPVYQLSASNTSNDIRSRNDFYITHKDTINALLDNEKFDNNVWEPACGNGAISECLNIRGYNVLSSDIFDYGYNNFNKKLDFLKIDAANKDLYQQYDIITNPPYSLSEEFVLKSIEVCKNKCALLLKIQFLETEFRFKHIFSKYPPKFIYVFSRRQACSKFDDFYQRDNDGNILYNKKGEPLKVGSAVLYCWFIWEKGYNGYPMVKWL